MNKKGILAILLGLLIVGLPTVMAKGYDTTEKKYCGTGVGQNEIHLGFNDYEADKNAEKLGKTRDPRPWFKNILRGSHGVSIFSRLSTWQECASE